MNSHRSHREAESTRRRRAQPQTLQSPDSGARLPEALGGALVPGNYYTSPSPPARQTPSRSSPSGEIYLHTPPITVQLGPIRVTPEMLANARVITQQSGAGATFHFHSSPQPSSNSAGGLLQARGSGPQTTLVRLRYLHATGGETVSCLRFPS